MREMGIRELKQTLSETIRAVAAGEHVRVTLRGRPVADLMPAGASAADQRLLELVTTGRLVPPSRARPSQAPVLVEGQSPASSMVLTERDDQD